MHILIFQHARVETAGSLGEFLKEDGHTFEVVHLDEGEQIPKTDNFDGLWVLGVALGCGLSEENKKADYFSCLRRELLAVTDGNQSLRLCRDKLYAEESAAQQTAGTAIYSYQ